MTTNLIGCFDGAIGVRLAVVPSVAHTCGSCDVVLQEPTDLMDVIDWARSPEKLRCESCQFKEWEMSI